MKTILVALAMIISTSAFGLEIKDQGAEYKTVMVKAEKVNGVKISLSKEHLRTDCNGTSININTAVVGGNMNDGQVINWHSTYIVTAFTSSTEAFCPIDTPVKETLTSEPLVLKSFSNRNIDREVLVSVIVPKGYKLVVEEY